MKTNIHLWYLAEFFLEWDMFQKKVAEKIKTSILPSVPYLQMFQNSCLSLLI